MWQHFVSFIHSQIFLPHNIHILSLTIAASLLLYNIRISSQTAENQYAAIDKIIAENAVRYPRLVGIPSTIHRRAPLFSIVFEDAKIMQRSMSRDD